ncbi:hypothetical protein VCHC56A1_3262, partial [Vibrio cholerae HC-56A1]
MGSSSGDWFHSVVLA